VTNGYQDVTQKSFEQPSQRHLGNAVPSAVSEAIVTQT